MAASKLSPRSSDRRGHYYKETTTAGPRIGIITSTFPFGFPETFFRAELEALSQLGLTITIFPCAPQKAKNNHPDLTLDVMRFSILTPKTLYAAVRGAFRNLSAVARALRVILWSRNKFIAKLKNLALFPTGLAVANEVVLRDIRHVHAYWLSGAATVGLIAADVANVSWSYTAHSGDIFLENNLIAEKTSSVSFGRVISEVARKAIVERSSLVYADRLNVIHIGVDVPNFADEKQPKSAPNTIRLLCPAHLVSFKGHAYLLKALRLALDRGMNCHCVLAGEGVLRGEIAREIRKLDLENFVSMPGMIPHGELLQSLRSKAYDAVVLASVDLEGIPVALMEAMAVGIPCIATRTGAVAELITQDCGILVEQRDPAALSDAIIELASDPMRRKRLGEQARFRIAESFDAKLSAQQLFNLIATSQAG